MMLPCPCPPLLPMLELKDSGCQGERTWFLGAELPLRQPTNSQDGLSTQLRVKDREVGLCLPDIGPFLGLVTASQLTSAEFPGLGLLGAYCSGQAELPRLRHLLPQDALGRLHWSGFKSCRRNRLRELHPSGEAMVTGWRNKRGATGPPSFLTVQRKA